VISVIIPTHNSEGTIEATLRSVKATEYSPLEIIVVDDASEDRTVEIARRHAEVVLTLDHQRGPAAARNFAAKRARGDVLLFMDSDVLIPEDLIATMGTMLDQEADLAGTASITSTTPLNPGFFAQFCALQEGYAICDYVGEDPENLPPDDFRKFAYITTRCGSVRKHIFEELGGFDERYTVPSIDDMEFSTRFLRKHHFLLVASPAISHQWPTRPARILFRYFRNAYLWSATIFPRDLEFNEGIQTRRRAFTSLLALASLAALAGSIFFRPLQYGFALLLLCYLWGTRTQLRYWVQHLNLWFALRASVFLYFSNIVIATGGLTGLVVGFERKVKNARAGKSHR
jgi:glycosyltransferase involved in cell wall biosynthesis